MSLAHFAECAICMDYIMEMVSVPCGHVFCNSCLQKHIVANGKRMSCACPGCNVEFSLVVPDNNILPQTLLTLATRTVRRIYLDTAPLVAHDKEVDRLVGLAATLEKRLHEANEREDACRRARRMEEIRANAAAAEHVQAFFRRMGIGAALALIPLLVLFVLFDRALVHLSKGDVGIIRYLY